jgi:hypothetical protein
VKFVEQIEKLDGTELKYKSTVKTLILLHCYVSEPHETYEEELHQRRLNF